MEHLPEPWVLITHDGDRYPFSLSIETRDGTYWIARDGVVSSLANARRLVACVNACAGVTTEALEEVTSEISLILMSPHWQSDGAPLEDPDE